MMGMRHIQWMIFAGLVLATAVCGHEAMAQRWAGDEANAHRSHTMSAPTRIIRAWRKLELHAPVYTIDDLADMPGWLGDAEIRRVDDDFGFSFIRIETGYTVFDIYPYAASQPTPDSPEAFECLVVKVEGKLTSTDLFAAIRERDPDVTIDAFSLSGVNVDIHKQTWIRLKSAPDAFMYMGASIDAWLKKGADSGLQSRASGGKYHSGEQADFGFGKRSTQASRMSAHGDAGH